MLRITNVMTSATFQRDLMRHEENIFTSTKALTSGLNISRPSDNPEIMLKTMRLRSDRSFAERFKTNIEDAKSFSQYADASMSQLTSVLQRLRELAVSASNGINTEEERSLMRKEVVQLTEQIVGISNDQYNGKYIYSGYEVTRPPFILNKSGDEITSVQYAGDDGKLSIDIGLNELVHYSVPGSKLFFSEDFTIVPQNNLANFIVRDNSSIKINNTEIQLYQGDTIETVIERINRAHTGIKANFDVNTQEFYLETSYPHRPFLEDVNGTILQDMGLIDPVNKPPYNIHNNARVFGGSLFDQLLNFSNALKNNDTEGLSARTIQFIDFSMTNVLKYQAEMGATSERLNLSSTHLDNIIVILEEQLMNTIGTDVPRAISDLKSFEFMKEASLKVGSRIHELTLLTFMR